MSTAGDSGPPADSVAISTPLPPGGLSRPGSNSRTAQRAAQWVVSRRRTRERLTEPHSVPRRSAEPSAPRPQLRRFPRPQPNQRATPPAGAPARQPRLYPLHLWRRAPPAPQCPPARPRSRRHAPACRSKRPPGRAPAPATPPPRPAAPHRRGPHPSSRTTPATRTTTMPTASVLTERKGPATRDHQPAPTV